MICERQHPAVVKFISADLESFKIIFGAIEAVATALKVSHDALMTAQRGICAANSTGYRRREKL
jgi:hypothetical protein